MPLPYIDGESDPTDYEGYDPNSGPKQSYTPASSYGWNTGGEPLPTPGMDSSTMGKPWTIQTPNSGKTLAQVQAEIAERQKTNPEDFTTPADRMLMQAHEMGGFKTMTDYGNALKTELYKEAAKLRIDLNSPQGKKWMNEAYNDGIAQAGTHGFEPIDVKGGKELSDGTFIDGRGRIIHQPQSIFQLGGQQDQGQSLPPPMSPPTQGLPSEYPPMSLEQTPQAQQYFGGMNQFVPQPTKPQASTDPLAKAREIVRIGNENPDIVASNKGMKAQYDMAKKAVDDYDKAKQKEDEDAILISDDAVGVTAQKYIDTGTMPPMGSGKKATETRNRILNKAADLMKDLGMSPEDQLQKQAVYTASQKELNKLQTQRGPIMAFEKTAELNIDQIRKLSSQVDRTAFPLINQAIMSGKIDALGDPVASQLALAIKTVADEYTRVLASQTGMTTDSAKAQTQSLLNKAQSDKQIKAVMDQMVIDMHNRGKGFDDQIEATKKLMTSSQPKKSESKSTPVRKPITKGPNKGKMAEQQPDGTWKVVK